MKKLSRKESVWVLQKMISRVQTPNSQTVAETWQTVSKPLHFTEANKRLKTKNSFQNYRLISGVDSALIFRSRIEETVPI